MDDRTVTERIYVITLRDGEVIRVSAPSLLEAQRRFMESRGIKVLEGPTRTVDERYYRPEDHDRWMRDPLSTIFRG